MALATKARRARIHFEDVDQIILDGELHIHQAHHIEGQRHDLGLALHFGDDGGFEGIGRQRAGAVAGMNACFLDMLHDSGDCSAQDRSPKLNAL